jgi:hypothetical protein
LLPQRLIEAVVRLELSQYFRRNRLFCGERAARNKAHHEERRRDDDKHHRNRLEQAAESEAEHRAWRESRIRNPESRMKRRLRTSKRPAAGCASGAFANFVTVYSPVGFSI